MCKTTDIELIEAAAGGDRSAAALLWEKYKGFIIYRANARKRAATVAGYGHIIDADDLVQAGYFALIKAAETYQPDRDAEFTTWLNYHLMNVFNETLDVRTRRGRSDPIQAADSLDALLPGTDDFRLLDTIPDKSDPFAEIIEADYQQSIFNMIRETINNLQTTESIRQMLLYMLDHDFNVSPVEALKHIEPESNKQRAWNLYKQGITRLRRELMKSKCKALYRDYYFPDAYRSGFREWQRTGMSCVERSVFKREKVLSDKKD